MNSFIIFCLGFISGFSFCAIAFILKNTYNRDFLNKHYKVEIKNATSYHSGLIKFSEYKEEK